MRRRDGLVGQDHIIVVRPPDVHDRRLDGQSLPLQGPALDDKARQGTARWPRGSGRCRSRWDTVHGIPSAAAPPGAPRPASGPLASFIVKSGALKGQRLAVKTPVVNIGRADYNDVVLPDESVSTTHAKLQRREGVWVLVDLDSTNGTFVDGDQVKGEMPLAPGASVRFGEIGL